MGITLSDLQELSDQGRDAILLCTECHGEYSANYHDYSFWVPASHTFSCCDQPMILGKHHRTFTLIKE